MAEKRKKLKVKEIKEVAPLSEVYELSPHSRYLVTLEVSSLVGGKEIAQRRAQTIFKSFQQAGIPCIVLLGVGPEVKFLELGAELEYT